ncbi:carbonic anhydrase 1-like [Uranotaenia lowii]|uniref:carbonic anhydrase 1-like n=1 Tax=Uranotaenia lowii TaxID=190385 RepID=UPI00247834AD|nr:carbonic anhydrase 1-like [Uranotaenia lowii]XP_055584753.1 carbonic anhydrase 1-like [Uranotaenia lowii]
MVLFPKLVLRTWLTIFSTMQLVQSVPLPRIGYYADTSPNGFFKYVDKNQRNYYSFYSAAPTEPPIPVPIKTVKHKHIPHSETWAQYENGHSLNSSFSYREEDDFGPSNWGSMNRNCEGIFQSPINLHTNKSIIVKKKRPLSIEGLQNRPRKMLVFNEGGTAAFFPEYGDGQRPRLRGGPLKMDYMFQQFHYHLGSEHTLDGKRSAAELHLVFYNSLYESIDDARDQVDGLAVIGLTFDVIKSTRVESFNKWTKYLNKIVEVHSEYNLPKNGLFPLAAVLGNVDWPFFAYEGSLTTPPCSETVQWIVASERMLLTKNELKLMRKLKGRGAEWVQNARPTQPVNHRRVYIY